MLHVRNMESVTLLPPWMSAVCVRYGLISAFIWHTHTYKIQNLKQQLVNVIWMEYARILPSHLSDLLLWQVSSANVKIKFNVPCGQFKWFYTSYSAFRKYDKHAFSMVHTISNYIIIRGEYYIWSHSSLHDFFVCVILLFSAVLCVLCFGSY